MLATAVPRKNAVAIAEAGAPGPAPARGSPSRSARAASATLVPTAKSSQARPAPDRSVPSVAGVGAPSSPVDGLRRSRIRSTPPLRSSAAEATVKVASGPKERTQPRADGAAAPTSAAVAVSTDAASGSACGRACRDRRDSAGARNSAMALAQPRTRAGRSRASPEAAEAVSGSAAKTMPAVSTPPSTSDSRLLRARSETAPVSGSSAAPRTPSMMRSTGAR